MTDDAIGLEDLYALFDNEFAVRRYADGVNQRDHALQCAALAERAGANDALVAASLLHDVGHLLTAGRRVPGQRPHEDLQHENEGGTFLRALFGPEVTAPVVLHVDAKRYLCAVDDDYFDLLSPGSVHSLELQGGPMSAEECRAFETRPGSQAATRLRRWDDGAKIPDAPCPPLEHYRPLLQSLRVVP